MTKKVIAVLALALGFAPVHAEHANISLRVIRLDPETGLTKDEALASADQEPPQGGIVSRPLFRVKAHEPLVLQFIFVNTYPHGVNKNVTVRYFVAPVAAAKQKLLPDLKDGSVVQGEFHMNFKPKCRAGARVAFTISQPGLYLLRVDSLNTSSDHEHFSAIDLQVE